MMRWQRVHIEIQESILTVLCRPEYIHSGIDAVRKARSELKTYLQRDPIFGTTHAPHHTLSNAPMIARRMAEAGRLAGTGPMAAVAGALAEACVTGLLEAGAPEAVADNGGDIVLFLQEPVHIGLWAGPEFPARLALIVPPREGLFSLCTSSGHGGPLPQLRPLRRGHGALGRSARGRRGGHGPGQPHPIAGGFGGEFPAPV